MIKNILVRWNDTLSYDVVIRQIRSSRYHWTVGFGVLDTKFEPVSDREFENIKSDGYFLCLDILK